MPGGINSRLVETGEEGEKTLFSCRAKIFEFESSEKAWKERGVGLLKLNATGLDDTSDLWAKVPDGDDSDGSEGTRPQKRARLIMRSDGSLRVVLNVALYKDMKVGDQNGRMPTDRMVRFLGVEEGKPKPVNLLIRTSNPQSAKDLCQQIYTFIDSL
jgi:Ran-binding protein 3